MFTKLKNKLVSPIRTNRFLSWLRKVVKSAGDTLVWAGGVMLFAAGMGAALMSSHSGFAPLALLCGSIMLLFLPLGLLFRYMAVDGTGPRTVTILVVLASATVLLWLPFVGSETADLASGVIAQAVNKSHGLECPVLVETAALQIR